MSEPSVRAEDRRLLAQLNDDFCHELDRGNAEGFVALFAPEALYTHGARVLRGTEQIREFYLGRTRDGPRTSRHMTSGLPPIPSTVPAIVADFDDVYVFDGGRWRFAERHIRPQFRAATLG
jgi:hypothetical protein